jgi:hypothetical protein
MRSYSEYAPQKPSPVREWEGHEFQSCRKQSESEAAPSRWGNAAARIGRYPYQFNFKAN